jgi:hypothetical protein
MVQITWFTFDEVAGGAERQRWYTLGGPVASGQTQASLTIYRNTGGNFDAPPRTMEQPVGTATLSFDSCTSGQLTYNFTDGSGRASTIPLTRLMPDVLCSKPTIDVEYIRGQPAQRAGLLWLGDVRAQWRRRGYGGTTLVHRAEHHR